MDFSALDVLAAAASLKSDNIRVNSESVEDVLVKSPQYSKHSDSAVDGMACDHEISDTTDQITTDIKVDGEAEKKIQNVAVHNSCLTNLLQTNSEDQSESISTTGSSSNNNKPNILIKTVKPLSTVTVHAVNNDKSAINNKSSETDRLQVATNNGIRKVTTIGSTKPNQTGITTIGSQNANQQKSKIIYLKSNNAGLVQNLSLSNIGASRTYTIDGKRVVVLKKSDLLNSNLDPSHVKVIKGGTTSTNAMTATSIAPTVVPLSTSVPLSKTHPKISRIITLPKASEASHLGVNRKDGIAGIKPIDTRTSIVLPQKNILSSTNASVVHVNSTSKIIVKPNTTTMNVTNLQVPTPLSQRLSTHLQDSSGTTNELHMNSYHAIKTNGLNIGAQPVNSTQLQTIDSKTENVIGESLKSFVLDTTLSNVDMPQKTLQNVPSSNEDPSKSKNTDKTDTNTKLPKVDIEPSNLNTNGDTSKSEYTDISNINTKLPKDDIEPSNLNTDLTNVDIQTQRETLNSSRGTVTVNNSQNNIEQLSIESVSKNASTSNVELLPQANATIVSTIPTVSTASTSTSAKMTKIEKSEIKPDITLNIPVSTNSQAFSILTNFMKPIPAMMSSGTPGEVLLKPLQTGVSSTTPVMPKRRGRPLGATGSKKVTLNNGTFGQLQSSVPLSSMQGNVNLETLKTALQSGSPNNRVNVRGSDTNQVQLKEPETPQFSPELPNPTGSNNPIQMGNFLVTGMKNISNHENHTPDMFVDEDQSELTVAEEEVITEKPSRKSEVEELLLRRQNSELIDTGNWNEQLQDHNYFLTKQSYITKKTLEQIDARTRRIGEEEHIQSRTKSMTFFGRPEKNKKERNITYDMEDPRNNREVIKRKTSDGKKRKYIRRKPLKSELRAIAELSKTMKQENEMELEEDGVSYPPVSQFDSSVDDASFDSSKEEGTMDFDSSGPKSPYSPSKHRSPRLKNKSYVKITGSFQDNFVYFATTKKRESKRKLGKAPEGSQIEGAPTNIKLNDNESLIPTQMHLLQDLQYYKEKFMASQLEKKAQLESPVPQLYDIPMPNNIAPASDVPDAVTSEIVEETIMDDSSYINLGDQFTNRPQDGLGGIDLESLGLSLTQEQVTQVMSAISSDPNLLEQMGEHSQVMSPIEQQIGDQSQVMSPLGESMGEHSQVMSPMGSQMGESSNVMSPMASQMGETSQVMSPMDPQMGEHTKVMSAVEPQMGEQSLKQDPSPPVDPLSDKKSSDPVLDSSDSAQNIESLTQIKTLSSDVSPKNSDPKQDPNLIGTVDEESKDNNAKIETHTHPSAEVTNDSSDKPTLCTEQQDTVNNMPLVMDPTTPGQDNDPIKESQETPKNGLTGATIVKETAVDMQPIGVTHEVSTLEETPTNGVPVDDLATDALDAAGSTSTEPVTSQCSSVSMQPSENTTAPSSINLPQSDNVPSIITAPSSIGLPSNISVPSSISLPSNIDVPSNISVPSSISLPSNIDVPSSISVPSSLDDMNTFDSILQSKYTDNKSNGILSSFGDTTSKFKDQLGSTNDLDLDNIINDLEPTALANMKMIFPDPKSSDLGMPNVPQLPPDLNSISPSMSSILESPAKSSQELNMLLGKPSDSPMRNFMEKPSGPKVIPQITRSLEFDAASRLDQAELFPDMSAPDIPPASDVTVPELCVVSMYWNDLPGLMINNKPYVRLVDIYKQVLPAKDTSILKKRCQTLGLPIACCSEMQRDFLVRYANAAQSKSTVIVVKEVAEELIGYYYNPKPRALSTNRSESSEHHPGVLSGDESEHHTGGKSYPGGKGKGKGGKGKNRHGGKHGPVKDKTEGKSKSEADVKPVIKRVKKNLPSPLPLKVSKRNRVKRFDYAHPCIVDSDFEGTDSSGIKMKIKIHSDAENPNDENTKPVNHSKELSQSEAHLKEYEAFLKKRQQILSNKKLKTSKGFNVSDSEETMDTSFSTNGSDTDDYWNPDTVTSLKKKAKLSPKSKLGKKDKTAMLSCKKQIQLLKRKQKDLLKKKKKLLKMRAKKRKLKLKELLKNQRKSKKRKYVKTGFYTKASKMMRRQLENGNMLHVSVPSHLSDRGNLPLSGNAVLHVPIIDSVNTSSNPIQPSDNISILHGQMNNVMEVVPNTDPSAYPTVIETMANEETLTTSFPSPPSVIANVSINDYVPSSDGSLQVGETCEIQQTIQCGNITPKPCMVEIEIKRPLEIVHRDRTHKKDQRGMSQDGDIFLHLYKSKNAPCVQCRSCCSFFSLGKFVDHLHDPKNMDIILERKIPQRLELRSTDISELEMKQWEEFIKLRDGFEKKSQEIKKQEMKNQEKKNLENKSEETQSQETPSEGSPDVASVAQKLNFETKLRDKPVRKKKEEPANQITRHSSRTRKIKKLHPIESYEFSSVTSSSRAGSSGEKKNSPKVEFCETQVPELESKLTKREAEKEMANMPMNISPSKKMRLESSAKNEQTRPDIVEKLDLRVSTSTYGTRSAMKSKNKVLIQQNKHLDSSLTALNMDT